MTKQSGELSLTKFTASHLPQALALSTEAGWTYRLEDWTFAFNLGQGLVLECEDRVIGTAMRWHYGDAFASIGMIIVSRKHKGQGHGARLVDALLAGAGSRSVFLNATPEAIELYRRRGFVCTGNLNQHQGVPTINDHSSQPPRIRTAKPADLPLIGKLDKDSLGMPRNNLLKSLAATGKMTVIEDDGIVNGYAVCRTFGRGYVIGPVITSSLADACALIEEAMSKVPGEIVRVDTDDSTGLSPWLESRGLKCVDTATPMVRGTPPKPSGQGRVFALCSQSLG